MQAQEVQVDVAELSTEQLIEAQYRSGELRFKLYPHQKLVYDLYRAFEARVIAGENDGPPIFVLDCARRWGKTFLVLIIKCEDAQRRPASRHTFATAIQDDIGEIILPLFEQIYEDCPDDCKPEVRTTKMGQNFGIYFPNGSMIKLVGVDKKPRGLRGRKSDGHAWTEAGFFAGLVEPVSRVMHQFQNVKHACLLMESSAPEDPEHDFDEVFVPDAKRRNAYVFQTINDNGQLTEEQKRKYYEDACKISVAEANRELFGIRSRDLGGAVIPEFNEADHVRDVPLPAYARCITSDDPGLTHLNGLVLACYDFANARIIVQASWAGLNAGSPRLAAVVAAREFALWGTWPPPGMGHIPLEMEKRENGAVVQGWRDLLLNDQYAHLAEQLHAMATCPIEKRPDHESTPGKFIREDIYDHVTYWNGIEHKPNPAGRVSDVDLQLIRSLGDHYGLEFTPTNKSELHAMVNLVRSWLSQGRLVFLPNSGPVIDHVRIGKWNSPRTKFAEHRSLGHFDVLSALVYLCRYVDQFVANECSPEPPSYLKIALEAGVNVQERLPFNGPLPHELELERRIRDAQHSGYESGRIKPYR